MRRLQTLLARLKPAEAGSASARLRLAPPPDVVGTSLICPTLSSTLSLRLAPLPDVVGTGGGQVRIHGDPNARRGGQRRAGCRGTAFRTDLDAAGGGATCRKKAAIPRRTPVGDPRDGCSPFRPSPYPRPGREPGPGASRRSGRIRLPRSSSVRGAGRGRPAGRLVTRLVPAARPRMTDPARRREGASQDPARKRGEPPRHAGRRRGRRPTSRKRGIGYLKESGSGNATHAETANIAEAWDRLRQEVRGPLSFLPSSSFLAGYARPQAGNAMVGTGRGRRMRRRRSPGVQT